MQRRLGPRDLVLIFVLGGVVSSLQARANGELGHRLGNSLEAALYSFATGLLILTVIAAASADVRAGLRRIPAAIREGTLPWWAACAGFLGGAFVASQAFSTALIGVALFSVAMVAGQTMTSLAVDRWGIGPAGRVGVTPRRIGAAALAIAAVVLAASGNLTGGQMVLAGVAVGVLGGIAASMQQALSGRTTIASRQPFATAWLSFALGTLGLAVGALVAGAAGRADFSGIPSGPWWMYIGGALGVVFITTAAWAVPRFGVLLVALISIAGQLFSALVLDIVAPVGAAGVPLTLVIAVLLTFTAVALASRRTADAGPRRNS